MARILIVDDDPAARKPMARLLLREGYHVACAEDASIAMAQVLDAPPDLILLDVAIPRMDGLTFLWRLRETAAGRHLPVVLVTGHDEPQTLKRAEELGIRAVLLKGQFKPADLLEVVHAVAPLTLTGAGGPGAASSGAGATGGAEGEQR